MRPERESKPPIRFEVKRPAEDQNGAEQNEKITAGVPLVKLIKRKIVKAPEVVMLNQAHSLAAERFRRLKTTLLNEQGDSIQVIVVTSSGPGEGKSLISTNLAMAFAADKQGEVLLIDADMRRPSIGRLLDPPPKLGLTEILRGQTELDHAILELENSPLKVLPSGTPVRNPVDLLSSARAQSMFVTLRQRYRRVIVDTAPVVPFTDADVIGANSDGVLLVARSGHTQQSLFARAISSITSTKIVGTVLNDVTYSLADRGTYDYDYYHEYYDKKRKR
jgi:capsular exopolysaccharide synthesis family protein